MDAEPNVIAKEHVVLEFKVKCVKDKKAAADEKDPKKAFINHVALSGSFEWVPMAEQVKRFGKNGIGMVHDDIVVAKLRPGQEIEAR